jgi:hypothetical protein
MVLPCNFTADCHDSKTKFFYIFGRFLTLSPLKRPVRREKNTSNMAVTVSDVQVLSIAFSDETLQVQTRRSWISLLFIEIQHLNLLTTEHFGVMERNHQISVQSCHSFPHSAFNSIQK